MFKSVVAVALGALFVVSVQGLAQAGSTPQKCEAGKLKVTSKKASCELGSESKVAAKGGSTDFTKCKSKFSDAIGKVQAKGGCTTSGDAGSIESKVDMFVADVHKELAVGTPNKCQAGKIKAVGKKQACEFGADAKAVVKGGTADFTKCKSSFSSSFSKLETKGGCTTSSDAATIEAKVDAFVSDVFNDVPTCSVDGAPCGSCGAGVCVEHCPGSSLVCLDDATFSNPGCATDAACPAGALCGVNGIAGTCGSGLANGCAKPCP